MTELLEKAIEAVSQLSAERQDEIAAQILAELKDEAAWDAAFASSQSQLAKLAKEVRKDIVTGKYRELDVDSL